MNASTAARNEVAGAGFLAFKKRVKSRTTSCYCGVSEAINSVMVWAAMLIAVPREEGLAESAAVLNTAEGIEELGAVFHGSELAFRIWVVLGRVGSAVGLGDAQVGHSNTTGLDRMAEPRSAWRPSWYGWIFCFSQVSSDELSGQPGPFPGSHHPADDITAEDVEDDLSAEAAFEDRLPRDHLTRGTLYPRWTALGQIADSGRGQLMYGSVPGQFTGTPECTDANMRAPCAQYRRAPFSQLDDRGPQPRGHSQYTEPGPLLASLIDEQQR